MFDSPRQEARNRESSSSFQVSHDACSLLHVAIWQFLVFFGVRGDEQISLHQTFLDEWSTGEPYKALEGLIEPLRGLIYKALKGLIRPLRALHSP